jgi:hypothetical protein
VADGEPNSVVSPAGHSVTASQLNSGQDATGGLTGSATLIILE